MPYPVPSTLIQREGVMSGRVHMVGSSRHHPYPRSQPTLGFTRGGTLIAAADQEGSPEETGDVVAMEEERNVAPLEDPIWGWLISYRGDEYPLTRSEYEIGRKDGWLWGGDIQYKHPYRISVRHCSIRCTDEGFTVSNLT